MALYDPCAGSGGMLIQSKQYVQETGGNPRDLFLAGQDSNGGTWAICKVNMILHGIRNADIRQGDTLKEPQHLDARGEIRRFDRVIANPPFSQNYSRNGMKFPERFHTFLPESGKKADPMFVQHMVASLKSDGRMAVVMPHGVLFRGGEEKACRQRFIKEGVLEAVVGLPPGLFYGTGIPACVLVINKQGAAQRKRVLFINADREFKEGKNQNSLRPEDIEKITHVYHDHLEVPKYSRAVAHEELAGEEYNLNIRRYVDNSPPPEPHDVRAHLHGGVPLVEIDALGHYFANYRGVREFLFELRPPSSRGEGQRESLYADFAAAIECRDSIKGLVESAPGVKKKHAAFHKALQKWWGEGVPGIEKLPGRNSVFELRRQFISSIAEALVPQGVLGEHQVRGAVAAYMNRLAADFKSVAASGWGPELIPEHDILESQFPDVLRQIEEDQARIAELEGLFAAANAADEEEEAEETAGGVLPKSKVKTLRDEKKALGGDRKNMNHLLADASDMEGEGLQKHERVEQIDAELARHSELEKELKQLKANSRKPQHVEDLLKREPVLRDQPWEPWR
ncbi:MAG: N-6 DNA methylase, partial [Planctomycetota bacterium]